MPFVTVMEDEHLFEPDYDDMSVHSLTHHRKNASNKCPICCTTVSNLKRHVYGIHLPNWYNSQLACLHCQNYIIGSIGHLCGQHLDVHASASCKFTNATEYQQRIMCFIKCLSLEVMRSNDVSGLLKLAQGNQWYPKFFLQHEVFNNVEMVLLKDVQMIWQEANVPSLSPPNCRASLLHW